MLVHRHALGGPGHYRAPRQSRAGQGRRRRFGRGARSNAELRRRTRANHTATHLLHAALKEVLGPHVKQAGSLVAPDRLRFDFTHFAPLDAGRDPRGRAARERADPAQPARSTSEEHGLEEAIASGAVAMFGEKYGERVRVVAVPGFSTELCGGTHVTATGDIGLFKIISDQSIASGVRRVEALTADDAFERYQLDEALLGVARAAVPRARRRRCRARSSRWPRTSRRSSASSRRSACGSPRSRRARPSSRPARSPASRCLPNASAASTQTACASSRDQLSQKLRSGVVVLGRRQRQGVARRTRHRRPDETHPGREARQRARGGHQREGRRPARHGHGGRQGAREARPGPRGRLRRGGAPCG